MKEVTAYLDGEPVVDVWGGWVRRLGAAVTPRASRSAPGGSTPQRVGSVPTAGKRAFEIPITLLCHSAAGSAPLGAAQREPGG